MAEFRRVQIEVKKYLTGDCEVRTATLVVTCTSSSKTNPYRRAGKNGSVVTNIINRTCKTVSWASLSFAGSGAERELSWTGSLASE